MIPSSIEERLIQVEVRVDEQRSKLVELSHQVRDLDAKVDRKVEALERTVNERFNAVDQRFNLLDLKIDGMRAELVKQFRWTVGVMITLAGIIVALVRP